MTIKLYLDDKDKTPINKFTGMISNPFRQGDIINLSVNGKVSNLGMVTGAMELVHKFDGRRIILKRETKYVEINALDDSEITIEYFCTFI